MPSKNTGLIVVLMLLGITSQAQICTGSLGDPVVNITFGAGTNPGGALPAGTNNYSFVPRDCPDDGSYTIINATANCFGSSWHFLQEDHTIGDFDGYMMLVNASFSPGDFYVDTVKGLCGGTTYEFAAWILNVLRSSACTGNGIAPNLTFSIESTGGGSLGTYQTGSIPALGSPSWKQYGLFFTTPPNASDIVLRITNNAPGGCGNDLVLDDITFRPCGPTAQAGIAGSTETTVERCFDDLLPIPMIGTVGSGYTNPAYRWQISTNDGITWSDITGAVSTSYTQVPSGPGKAKYRLTVAEGGNIGISACRIATNEIDVNIHEQPGKGIGSNNPICLSDSIRLKVDAGTIFSWTGPNGFSSHEQNPTLKASLPAAGTYNLEASDDIGCFGSASTVLQVFANPVALVNPDATICEGKSVQLAAAGGQTYSWSPVSGLSASNVANPVANLSSSTILTVVVFNGPGCTDTASIAINVLKTPVADAGPDKIIFEGQSVTLDGVAVGSEITWKWTPVSSISNSSAIRPSVSPTEDITYSLTVQSNAGCGVDTDEVFVRVFKKVIVPTAFSPNGDGINDIWRIKSLTTYPESDVSVFNRYGQLVFESKGYLKEWDGTRNGKPLASDTYYYIIDLKNNLPRLQGWVFIIR